MKQQLLTLYRNQTGSHIHREGPAIISDEKYLPDLIDPQGNWGISATKQWDPEEIEFIATTPATELIDTFAQTNDPWLYMGVAAELILHDDVSRARAFTQGLIEKNPQVRADFAHYFGEPLVTELLKEGTVA